MRVRAAVDQARLLMSMLQASNDGGGVWAVLKALQPQQEPPIAAESNVNTEVTSFYSNLLTAVIHGLASHNLSCKFRCEVEEIETCM